MCTQGRVTCTAGNRAVAAANLTNLSIRLVVQFVVVFSNKGIAPLKKALPPLKKHCPHYAPLCSIMLHYADYADYAPTPPLCRKAMLA